MARSAHLGAGHQRLQLPPPFSPALVERHGVPHLHVHLVPRPQDDPRAGVPLETDAFDHDHQQPLAEDQLDAEASALRAALRRESY